MILEILHRLASRPWVYDQIQTVAGSQKVIKRLSRHITTLDPKVVLDIGGGTGALRNLFAADCRYICLDVEMPKLQRFRSKTVGALAVLGDATSTPIRDGCADPLRKMRAVRPATSILTLIHVSGSISA